MDFAKTIKRPKGAHVQSINPPVALAKPFIIKALKDDEDSRELASIIKKVKKVHVMLVSLDTLSDNSQYLKAMADRMDQYLQKNNYEAYATVRSKGQKVGIHAIQEGDVIRQLMIHVISPDNGEVYVHLKAKLSPDDLSKLINSMDN